MNHIINQQIINQVQLDYNNIPLAVFLVGTNGCGKSSLRSYLNLSDIQTNIDPDVLNRIYKSKFPTNYQIESGKQALKMYNEAIKQGLNVCLESTLAGKGTMQRIMAAKAAGYFTVAYYIGLCSVELNLERIAMRVARGGHDIPSQAVQKRFYESSNNLISIKDQLNELHIIDNSDSFFKLQYSISNNVIVNHSRTMEDWAERLLKKLNNTVIEG